MAKAYGGSKFTLFLSSENKDCRALFEVLLRFRVTAMKMGLRVGVSWGGIVTYTTVVKRWLVKVEKRLTHPMFQWFKTKAFFQRLCCWLVLGEVALCLGWSKMALLVAHDGMRLNATSLVVLRRVRQITEPLCYGFVRLRRRWVVLGLAMGLQCLVWLCNKAASVGASTKIYRWKGGVKQG